MNLYFRLLIALWRGFFKPRIGMGETITRQCRVLLNDIDINGHMNNGRYTTVVDLLLVEAMLRSKLLIPALRQGWVPAMGGNIISYRKQMRLLEPYRVSFRVCGWDEHWTFFEYEFRNLKDQVVSRGYSKGAFIGKRGLIPVASIDKTMGIQRPDNWMPEAITQWLQADNAINRSC